VCRIDYFVQFAMGLFAMVCSIYFELTLRRLGFQSFMAIVLHRCMIKDSSDRELGTKWIDPWQPGPLNMSPNTNPMYSGARALNRLLFQNAAKLEGAFSPAGVENGEVNHADSTKILANCGRKYRSGWLASKISITCPSLDRSNDTEASHELRNLNQIEVHRSRQVRSWP